MKLRTELQFPAKKPNIGEYTDAPFEIPNKLNLSTLQPKDTSLHDILRESGIKSSMGSRRSLLYRKFANKKEG